MVTIIVVLAACILFAIGLLHVFWALGGQWGTRAVIPEQEGEQAFVPGVWETFLIALLVSLAGLFLLLRTGLVEFSFPAQDFIVRVGVWVCAVVFALRVIGEFNLFGIFKKKRATTFSKMDTYLYVPLCAFLSLAFVLAIGYGE
ncbi:DUF3995 domain-containing protein [Paenibacillus sp. GYB004]|uniref:DUF3995 domain-containing protein n=1 Tax=Paenibacillus sp. GYB004 TaxID=2994393 RepID=UPI002F96C000